MTIANFAITPTVASWAPDTVDTSNNKLLAVSTDLWSALSTPAAQGRLSVGYRP